MAYVHKKGVSSSGPLEITKCAPVSTDVVSKELHVFLRKRQVREGLSSENIVHLQRLQRSLQKNLPK